MVSFAKEEDPPHQGQPMMSSSGKTIKKQKMSRISSLNHVIANGDKTTEFLLKKKEQNFNYLTVKILKEQQQQNLAGLHFQAMYDHLLFLRKFMYSSLLKLLLLLLLLLMRGRVRV
jgi:hypothetical protein